MGDFSQFTVSYITNTPCHGCLLHICMHVSMSEWNLSGGILHVMLKEMNECLQAVKFVSFTENQQISFDRRDIYK